jgi:hypothetical protein
MPGYLASKIADIPPIIIKQKKTYQELKWVNIGV